MTKYKTKMEKCVEKRKKHKISAEKVGEKVGVSKKQYINWENGSLVDSIYRNIEKIESVHKAINELIKEKKNG